MTFLQAKFPLGKLGLCVSKVCVESVEVGTFWGETRRLRRQIGRFLMKFSSMYGFFSVKLAPKGANSAPVGGKLRVIDKFWVLVDFLRKQRPNFLFSSYFFLFTPLNL